MADPTSTTDYPVFSGATGKRDCLRALLAAKGNTSRVQGVMFQIANSDLNGWTDKSTLYDPRDCFNAITP